MDIRTPQMIADEMLAADQRRRRNLDTIGDAPMGRFSVDRPTARDWVRLAFEAAALFLGIVGTVLAIGHALALAFGWRL